MNPSALVSSSSHAVKCELAGEVLRSSGSLRLQVTGWSMLPTIWPGDTLMIERIGNDEVCNGDIVLFRSERRIFAHRVVGKSAVAGDETILTRGDSMSQADSPVPSRDLLGRVSFVLRNGKQVKPARTLRFTERAVARAFQRSGIAARVIVGVHGLRQSSQITSQVPAVPLQKQ
jgi:signal peptidase I